MGHAGVKDVLLTPLKIIHNPLGDILHGMKKGDPGFIGFGEAYFSMVNFNEVKGWNRHKKMTLNLIVPTGNVLFVIYNPMAQIENKDSNFCKFELSLKNYQRLTVPPGLWIAFKGKTAGNNLILNLADLDHDPNEIEKIPLEALPYDWDAI